MNGGLSLDLNANCEITFQVTTLVIRSPYLHAQSNIRDKMFTKSYELRLDTSASTDEATTANA